MCVLRGVCVSVLYNLVLHNYVVLSIQCFFLIAPVQGNAG